MDLYPGVEISINVSNKNNVIQELVNNISDFSLVSVLPEDLKISKVELLQNKLYLVGSSRASRKVNKPSDLKNVPLLFREEGSATRSIMQRYLDENNIKVGKSMELVSNEAVKQAVNAGLGYSIMPLIGLKSVLSNDEMKIYPLKGLPILTKWNLIYNRDKKLTPAREELVNFMEQNKENLASEHFGWALDI